jgi:hypothetical protein
MEATLQAEIIEPSQDGQASGPVDGLASQIASEHNASAAGSGATATVGRKPGRPPVHGRYSQAAGSDGKHPVTDIGGQEIPPAEVETTGNLADLIPPDLLVSVIQETLTTGEAYAQGKIETVARAAGLESADITAQLKQAHLSPAKRELIARLTPLAAQEWGLSLENLSPTAVIAFLIVPTALSATSAYFTLAKLAIERQKILSTKTAVEKSGGK